MNSMVVYAFVLVTSSALVLGSSLYRPNMESNLDETKLQAAFDNQEEPVGTKPITGQDISYLTWLRYALGNHKLQPTESKRFTSFTMPYFKYQKEASGKRTGNGVWIWMPAQGYVSVPKNQQEAFVEDDAGKPGKIMRYGK